MEMNRHFSKEEVKMANKKRHECSTSLAFREMQIKTTMRSISPVRMAIIKKTNKCWQIAGRKLPYWWECTLVQPL
jgi:hypothetical protein